MPRTRILRTLCKLIFYRENVPGTNHCKIKSKIIFSFILRLLNYPIWYLNQSQSQTKKNHFPMWVTRKNCKQARRTSYSQAYIRYPKRCFKKQPLQRGREMSENVACTSCVLSPLYKDLMLISLYYSPRNHHTSACGDTSYMESSSNLMFTPSQPLQFYQGYIHGRPKQKIWNCTVQASFSQCTNTQSVEVHDHASPPSPPLGHYIPALALLYLLV